MKLLKAFVRKAKSLLGPGAYLYFFQIITRWLGVFKNSRSY